MADYTVRARNELWVTMFFFKTSNLSEGLFG